jgi:hypothetical protein
MGQIKKLLPNENAETENNAVTVASPQLPQQMPAPGDDGWADAAAELEDSLFRGTRLSFSDRQWATGKEKVPVEEGRRFLVRGTALVWLKWRDKKMVQVVARQPGQRFPDRTDLDDQDPETWEVGLGDDMRDPWQLTRFVYLVALDKTAETLTYASSAFGAHSAARQLADQIQTMRVARPGAIPVIRLDCAPFQTKYGMKSKPLFEVVDWQGGETRKAKADDSPAGAEQTKPDSSEWGKRDEIDDEIPF